MQLLREFNRMRFLKTPFKPLRRLVFGGYTGFTELVKTKIRNQDVFGLNFIKKVNKTAYFREFFKTE